MTVDLRTVPANNSPEKGKLKGTIIEVGAAIFPIS